MWKVKKGYSIHSRAVSRWCAMADFHAAKMSVTSRRHAYAFVVNGLSATKNLNYYLSKFIVQNHPFGIGKFSRTAQGKSLRTIRVSLSHHSFVLYTLLSTFTMRTRFSSHQHLLYSLWFYYANMYSIRNFVFLHNNVIKFELIEDIFIIHLTWGRQSADSLKSDILFCIR